MTPNRKGLIVLIAAYAIPISLFLFGGEARPFAWFAVVTAMALVWREEAKTGDASPEDWGSRFTVTAFILAGLLAYGGLSAAEGDRTLRRELAMICDGDDALCDRLDEARASAADARNIAGGGDDE